MKLCDKSNINAPEALHDKIDIYESGDVYAELWEPWVGPETLMRSSESCWDCRC